MINCQSIKNLFLQKWLIIFVINLTLFLIISSGLLVYELVVCCNKYCLSYAVGWFFGGIILLINYLITVHQIKLYKIFHKKLLIVLPLFKIILYGLMLLMIWVFSNNIDIIFLIVGLLQQCLFLWIRYFLLPINIKKV